MEVAVVLINLKKLGIVFLNYKHVILHRLSLLLYILFLVSWFFLHIRQVTYHEKIIGIGMLLLVIGNYQLLSNYPNWILSFIHIWIFQFIEQKVMKRKFLTKEKKYRPKTKILKTWQAEAIWHVWWLTPISFNIVILLTNVFHIILNLQRIQHWW